MRFFLALLLLVIGAPAFAEDYPSIPEEWKSCSSKEDCVLIRNGCCGYSVVNKTHEAEAAKMLGPQPDQCEAVSCVPPLTKKTTCKDQRCIPLFK